jgi:hypothetical protein
MSCSGVRGGLLRRATNLIAEAPCTPWRRGTRAIPASPYQFQFITKAAASGEGQTGVANPVTRRGVARIWLVDKVLQLCFDLYNRYRAVDGFNFGDEELLCALNCISTGA